MKKRLCLAIICIVSCFIISGCVDSQVGVTFNEDGSITEEVDLKVDSDNYLVQENMDDVKDTIDNQKEDLRKKGFKLESDHIFSFKAVRQSANLDELKTKEYILLKPDKDSSSKGLLMRKGFLYDYYSWEKDFKGGEKFPYTEFQQEVENSRCDFVLNLPYSADSSSADRVENNGKTLIWDFKSPLMEGRDINVNANFKIYHKKNIIILSAIAGCLVFIALLLIVWTVMKRPEGAKRNIMVGTAAFLLVITAGGGLYVKHMIDNPPQLNEQDAFFDTTENNDIFGRNSISSSLGSGNTKSKDTSAPTASINKNTILGTWQGAGGNTVKIDANNFGKASYTVNDVSVSGTTTVIKVSLNGGKSVSSLVFSNNDADHFTLHNISTGYTEEYTRK